MRFLKKRGRSSRERESSREFFHRSANRMQCTTSSYIRCILCILSYIELLYMCSTSNRIELMYIEKLCRCI